MNKLILVLVAVALLYVLGCTENSETSPATGRSVMKTVGEEPRQTQEISMEELSLHDSEDDCWVVYGGKVYDITSAPRHPNMENSFFRHCGEPTGFEEGAKARHSTSSTNRVENYAKIVGELK